MEKGDKNTRDSRRHGQLRFHVTTSSKLLSDRANVLQPRNDCHEEVSTQHSEHYRDQQSSITFIAQFAIAGASSLHRVLPLEKDHHSPENERKASNDNLVTIRARGVIVLVH